MIRADQHLVLVGMMGVGKSTVARVLAQRLGREILDTDAIIETRTGRSVREIFSTDGEPQFRSIESEVFRDALAAPEPAIIVAGGGVVLSASNRVASRAAVARVVWLCAEPTTLVERVQSGQHRPLLDDDPAGTLNRMCAEREPLYREVADAIVRVDHRSVHEVAEAVLR
ncbi:MAG: shikimate kinase [Actinobacteria bacterium]|nr:shikimate kinase [Actinomycetota bacterium]